MSTTPTIASTTTNTRPATTLAQTCTTPFTSDILAQTLVVVGANIVVSTTSQRSQHLDPNTKDMCTLSNTRINVAPTLLLKLAHNALTLPIQRQPHAKRTSTSGCHPLGVTLKLMSLSMRFPLQHPLATLTRPIHTPSSSHHGHIRPVASTNKYAPSQLRASMWHPTSSCQHNCLRIPKIPLPIPISRSLFSSEFNTKDV